MSERNRTAFESELVAALRFDPARAAPSGAASRVRERMLATAAGEKDRPSAVGIFPSAGRIRRTSAGLRRSVLLSVAGALLAGAVAAGIGVTWIRRPVWMEAIVPSPPRESPYPSKLRSSSATALGAHAEAPPDPLPPAAPLATDSPISARVAAAPSSAPAAPHASSAGAASTLNAERALVDGARLALAAGAYQQSMRALTRHARRFPSGVLAEEREALVVKTLAAQGRYEEVRVAAAHFVERYPRSLFRQAVEEAVQTIP